MSRRRKYRGNITVDVDVEIDEVLEALSDDDIREEMKARGLEAGADIKTAQEHAAEALSDLMANRPGPAAEAIVRAIAEHVPADLIEAQQALARGDISEAICRLDAAAFRFKLPMKREKSANELRAEASP